MRFTFGSQQPPHAHLKESPQINCVTEIKQLSQRKVSQPIEFAKLSSPRALPGTNTEKSTGLSSTRIIIATTRKGLQSPPSYIRVIRLHTAIPSMGREREEGYLYIYISLCVYKTRERATLITFTPLFEGQPHARKHRPQKPRVPAPHCIYCVSLVLTSVLATRQFPESRTGFQNDTTAQIISQKTEVRELTSSQRVLQMDVLNNNFPITMSKVLPRM